MSRPCLAAITLNATGGGVASVSRLLSRVLEDRWPGAVRLVTLLDERAATRSLESSIAIRLRFGAQMAMTQASRQCDWIMYSHLSVAKVQAFVPPLLRRPYAVFIHGIEAWRHLTPAQESVLRGAALRVANSVFTAGRVAALHPGIGSVASCPLALPPETCAVSDASFELPFDLGPRAVIVVARMSATERYKGHDELLDAWPRVLTHAPDARLVFVGGGDDRARLHNRARSLGVAGSVLFTGFVSERDLIAFYRKAAVFAMPSRGEGFGLVYLEAMAHSLPCIGALDDAAGEIIEDGRTGFLIQQSDCEGLSDRLVRLLTDDSLRRAMGGAGHHAVQHRFSYERFSRRMLSLIESTVAMPAPAWGRGAAL